MQTDSASIKAFLESTPVSAVVANHDGIISLPKNATASEALKVKKKNHLDPD